MDVWRSVPLLVRVGLHTWTFIPFTDYFIHEIRQTRTTHEMRYALKIDNIVLCHRNELIDKSFVNTPLVKGSLLN